MKRFLFVTAAAVGTYLLVDWITGLSLLALACEVISCLIAMYEWDRRHPSIGDGTEQRRNR